MTGATAAAPAPVRRGVAIERVEAHAYTIPTNRPEADGTLSWDSTTIVVVQIEAGGEAGVGYTYSHGSIVRLIADKLAPAIGSCDALDPAAAWDAMQRAVRNFGRGGLAATAISSIDAALWDLEAKLLGLPLVTLLGSQREAVPVYGSGGFTTYDDATLSEQLGGWAADGCAWVKMKVGTDPADDPRRAAVAKAAIGDKAILFVDANGAYDVKQALALADVFAAEADVRWFEEPVSSDDLTGLHDIRRRAPARMDIAAGEYGFHPDYFVPMVEAGAVDVVQADATRCGGFTGFLRVAAFCDAHHLPISAHCAPALHLHAACAAPRLRHVEWFHDHVRVEHLLFDGAPTLAAGAIRPDLSRPGIGLALKRRDAQRFAAD